MVRKRITSALTAVFVMALAVPSIALAAPTTEVVTEDDVTRQVENTPPTDNWVLYTRVGTPPTAAAFIEGPDTPPLREGSLQLTTTTGGEKVFLFNFDHTGTNLADISDISYSTFRTSGSAQQVAALNLQVDYNGDAAGGFTTLVFEPVYNTDQGAVESGEWQDWIADGSGIWWSTRPINGQCAGAVAGCFTSWDDIVANNPDAVIIGGVGVNQGSGNPALVSAVDAFTFDEVTYDFERDAPRINATSKDDCKNGGWETFEAGYKNQGDCVSSVASEGRAGGNPSEPATNTLRELFN